MYRVISSLRLISDVHSISCHRIATKTFVNSLLLFTLKKAQILLNNNRHFAKYLLSTSKTIKSFYFNTDFPRAFYWQLSSRELTGSDGNIRRGIQFTPKRSSEKHRNCWNCGRDTSPVLELFFCDCGVVQKPAIELTYFDLMLLDTSFDIDTKKLSQVFKETQMKLHPDKFSSKSETERMLAEEQSSLLNKAYNVLQKPLSRALYMLKLQGVPIQDDANFSDPDFLMDIMQTNESISSVQKDSDLDKIDCSNNSKIDGCILQLSESFRSRDYTKAQVLTIRLRYYTTIQERIFELRRSRLD